MSNPKTALIVRTRLSASDPTRVCYDWAETAKKSFEANGWKVLDLAEDEAVRANVEKALQVDENAVFLFYGHGLPDQMTGQDGVALIDLANIHLLKNHKVYVVACWTAKILGKEAANVARSYLGYEKYVIVWLHPPIRHIWENVWIGAF